MKEIDVYKVIITKSVIMWWKLKKDKSKLQRENNKGMWSLNKIIAMNQMTIIKRKEKRKRTNPKCQRKKRTKFLKKTWTTVQKHKKESKKEISE